MKKIVFVWLIMIGCTQKPDRLPIQSEDTLYGLASPIRLGFDTTKLYWNDYFPLISKVDSFNLPSGLAAIKMDQGQGIILTGSQINGIDNLRVYIKGSTYDIPVLKSRKKQYLFRFEDREKKYSSITIAGSMNGWVSTKDSLGFSNGYWIKPIILDPGEYQYHLFLDGKEMLDPNNPDSVDNGMGGFNSVFEVVGNDTEISMYPDSVWESGFSVKGTAKGADYFVYWQNYLLPDSYVKKSDQGFSVKIPDESKKIDRSDIRFWASSGEAVSNDLLIPLRKGRVIQDPSQLLRADKHKMIMYFALVDRFFDADPDNNRPTPDSEIKPLANNLGGDIRGIWKKLNDGYFDSLNVNTIWLSPIGRNPDGAWGLWDKGGVKSKFSGYHGYWPAKSRTIDPRFGTDQDLIDLTDLAHQNGYSILIDYVANHIHKDHPVYELHPEWATELYLPDGSLNTEKWDEHRLTTWFDTFLPTLDLENPVVADAMSDSAIYWFENFQIDGFRHDATKHVPTDFWRMLTYKLKTRVMMPQNRAIYQIGETYGNPELIGSYISSGLLDAQFDFNLYDASIASIGREEISFSKLESELEKSLQAYGGHHLMGNMSGNQDRPRFISYADGSVDWGEDSKLAGWTREISNQGEIGFRKLAMLHAFNMTSPGIPVIYYGDEIGLPGANDPDNRRMMIFDQLDPLQKDLWNSVSKLCSLRKENISLIYGETVVHQADEQQFIMSRSYFEQTTLLILNKSSEEIIVKNPIQDPKTIESFFGNEYSAGEEIAIGQNSFEILTLTK